MVSRKEAKQYAAKLDSIANEVQENYAQYGMNRKAAHAFCLNLDRVSDSLERLVHAVADTDFPETDLEDFSYNYDIADDVEASTYLTEADLEEYDDILEDVEVYDDLEDGVEHFASTQESNWYTRSKSANAPASNWYEASKNKTATNWYEESKTSKTNRQASRGVSLSNNWYTRGEY